MFWRIVVQILALIVSRVFAVMLRDFKSKADYYDLYAVEPTHSLRREAPVRVRSIRHVLLAYSLMGAQCGLLVATIAVRSRERRSWFTLLSLAATLSVQIEANRLTPEFDRSWSRLLDRREALRIKRLNVTRITDAPSKRSA